MGYILPGRPIANVCFKTYGYISMSQAVSFLNDFKLGHYMKIPSKIYVHSPVCWDHHSWNRQHRYCMVAPDLDREHMPRRPPPSKQPLDLPGRPRLLRRVRHLGLVGPKRNFGTLGNYSALNWFFLGGALRPVLVWAFHRAFPSQTWIKMINLPVLLGGTAAMPPATTLNFNSRIFVGTIFNYFIF